MPGIGLIREGKIPSDNRVAFTPAQCKWILQHYPEVSIEVQSSPHRCFSDKEYTAAGIKVVSELSDCDLVFGIKEIPVSMLRPNCTYLFFSHTRKQQPQNRDLFRALLHGNNTLIDYECLEHEDGQRILGFGFFAGVVGAHNGIMAYGKRTGHFDLERVYRQKSFRTLIHTYFGLKLPPIKIAVTGSGRVAHGILEIMNLMEVIEVEPEEFLNREFSYPVFTQIKGADLYRHKISGNYNREDFHVHPSNYECIFQDYAGTADILMNGIYWDIHMPRLFEKKAIQQKGFHIRTIADITDDKGGSVPINLGDSTIEDPVYGVDIETFEKTSPYLENSIDVMAVGNLPNELPRDASRYFGQQLIKNVLKDLLEGRSTIIENATMISKGRITPRFEYLEEYGGIVKQS